MQQANFGKRHGQKEEGGRRTNFINAQRRIERHNRFSKGWQMSHNKFSDMVQYLVINTLVSIHF